MLKHSKKLREFLLRQSDDVVKGMIERKTFPSYSDDFYSQMKKADMIRVTKELYCLEPRIFYRLKDIQEKSLLGFLDLLLNSEERENVLTIIEGIVELTPKQRQEFAGMLQNTKMQNIVESIKLVEDRYRVIEILRTLIYDLTAFTNERDHIQEIIENHYWLFGEQYNLVSADKRMQVALERYRHILDGTHETNLALLGNDEANRRMDIFLAGARKTIDSADNILDENLIIELKKPSVKLDKVVYRQIEDYMEYIRRQPEFNSQYRIWKFIAVCATVDDFILERYKAFENRNKKCLVLQVENYEVYAMTWDDVFKSFDIRHSFILDKLKYNRDSLAQKIKEQTKEHNRDLSNEITLAAVGDNSIELASPRS